jgi:hypothetical protein
VGFLLRLFRSPDGVNDWQEVGYNGNNVSVTVGDVTSDTTVYMLSPVTYSSADAGSITNWQNSNNYAPPFFISASTSRSFNMDNHDSGIYNLSLGNDYGGSGYYKYTVSAVGNNPYTSMPFTTDTSGGATSKSYTAGHTSDNALLTQPLVVDSDSPSADMGSYDLLNPLAKRSAATILAASDSLTAIDRVPPKLLSAKVKPGAEDAIELAFSEAVTISATSGFSITGARASTAISSVSGSGAAWTVRLNNKLIYSDRVKLSYTNTETIRDAAGNLGLGIVKDRAGTFLETTTLEVDNSVYAPSASFNSGNPISVSGTVANANGSGWVSAAQSSAITISLTNALVSSDVSSAAGNNDASSWFSSTIAGLSYTASAAANASTISISITGTPEESKTQNGVTISVPGSLLTGLNGLVVLGNIVSTGTLQYNVLQASANTRPVLSGNLYFGEALSSSSTVITAGTVTSATLLSYSWERSSDQRAWTPIPATNASSYVLTEADVSHYLRLVVSQAGNGSVTSLATGQVTKAAFSKNNPSHPLPVYTGLAPDSAEKVQITELSSEYAGLIDISFTLSSSPHNPMNSLEYSLAATKPGSDAAGTRVSSAAASSVSLTNQAATNGQYIWIRVKESATHYASDWVCGPQIDLAAPAAPTVTAPTVSNGQAGSGFIDLHWKNPSTTDFDHVQITYYKTLVPGTKYSYTAPVAAYSSDQNYRFNGLENGQQYIFVLTALDKHNNKSATVQTSGTPLADKGFTVTFTSSIKEETINLASLGSLSWVENDPLTVSVSGLSVVGWYVDGGTVSLGSSSSITKYAQDFGLGMHTLAVKVSVNGVEYSKTVTFEVTE